MTERGVAAYHLRELAIARDPASPEHVQPEIGPADRTIVDLGCGAGQSLIAAGIGEGRTAIGVDIDLGALALGRTLTTTLHFVAGRAEVLPIASSTVDLVISRVALPYTDVPAALREIGRVLRPGGRCWLALHPPALAWRELIRAIRRASLRAVAYQLYVLANGTSLHLVGRQFAYPLRRTRFESVQRSDGVRRALIAAGFGSIVVERGRFFVVTAVRDR